MSRMVEGPMLTLQRLAFFSLRIRPHYFVSFSLIDSFTRLHFIVSYSLDPYPPIMQPKKSHIESETESDLSSTESSANSPTVTSSTSSTPVSRRNEEELHISNHDIASPSPRDDDAGDVDDSSCDSSPPPAAPLKLDYPLDHSAEFNDGTVSPLPSDPYSYWMDPYAAAWNCMSEKEEEEYFNSPDYRYFVDLMKDSRLIVNSVDLPNIERWRALGFFLSKNPEVQSLRFQGVDLQVSDFKSFKQVLFKAALTNRHRPRKRTHHHTSYKDDTSSSSSSSSSSSRAPHTSHPLDCDDPVDDEWCGGWGLDIDSIESVRRRREMKLRHITFIQNEIGTMIHPPNGEVKSSSATHPTRTSTGRSNSHHGSTSDSALENVISLLLFYELLETVSIWRNNLSDDHAVRLTEELLLKHPSLRKLSLRWNGITADGVKRIEAILNQFSPNESSTSSLEEIDLAFNRIDVNQATKFFTEGYQISPAITNSSATGTTPSTISAPSNSTTNLSTSNHLNTSGSLSYDCASPLIRKVTSPNSPHSSIVNNSVPSKPSPACIMSHPTSTRTRLPPLHPPTNTSQPVSSATRRPYTINLRSQLPHSTTMLAHFLRRTAVYQWSKTHVTKSWNKHQPGNQYNYNGTTPFYTQSYALTPLTLYA